MRREYEALNKLIGRNFAVLNDGMGVYLTPKGEIRDIDGRLLLPELEGRARLFERNLAEPGKGGGTSDAVQYIPQELTTEQQMQARENLNLHRKESTETEFVEETEVTIIETLQDGSYFSAVDTDVVLEDGKTYAVYFNNKKYTSKAAIVEVNGVKRLKLGNEAIGGFGNDTGEPFLATNGLAGIMIFTKTNDPYTIAFAMISETITPIPPEYLPGTFIPTAVIKSSDYDNALMGVQTAIAPAGPTYECINMTFEDAYKRVRKGFPISAVYMGIIDERPGYEVVRDYNDLTNQIGQPCLLMSADVDLFWTENGIYTTEPSAN